MVPQGFSDMYVSWPTIGVICAILTLVITMVSRVMQQSIKGTIQDSMTSLEEKIEKKFSSKESVEGELRLLNLRLQHLEADIADVRRKVTKD